MLARMEGECLRDMFGNRKLDFRDDKIYDTNGNYLGEFRGDSLYNATGNRLGEFRDGGKYFYDVFGNLKFKT
jgi:hypothetical protein